MLQVTTNYIQSGVPKIEKEQNSPFSSLHLLLWDEYNYHDAMRKFIKILRIALNNRGKIPIN